jgi:hypothetical protein
MNANRVELTLAGAPGEPAFTSEGQAEAEKFDADLRRQRLEVTALAVGSGPGILTGQFLVTLGPAVIAAIAAVAGAWVHARYGRKVRLKVGDIEAEARTTEEIEALLRHAVELRNGKRDDVADQR